MAKIKQPRSLGEVKVGPFLWTVTRISPLDVDDSEANTAVSIDGYRYDGEKLVPMVNATCTLVALANNQMLVKAEQVLENRKAVGKLPNTPPATETPKLQLQTA